jgi:hypothetical protein
MGQYWKPIMIENMEWVYSHDYDNGLKLMEHSWIGNNFVGVVMKLLSKGEKWYKKPIVWCGDYFSEEGEENYYDKADDNLKIMPVFSMKESEQVKCVLVNHTKKEYVIISPEDFKKSTKVKAQAKKMLKVIEGNEEREWKIHPLPLLTALGNGRGGGDFRGENDMIGYWARDILSVEKEIPKGYAELNVEFREDG